MRVLTIVVRGLHLGYVGCYGNEWLGTPTLDGLAAEGVVFDQHYADQPDTAGAAHAWRSGRYGFPADDVPSPPTPSPDADLVSLLRAAEVGLALVVDDSRPGAGAFAEGWEDVTRVGSGPGEGTTLERTLDAVAPALDRLTGFEHALLWVELATLLPPWDVPAEDLERYCQEPAADDEEEEEEEEPAELEPLPDPAVGPLDPTDDTAFLRLQRTYAGAVGYLDAGLAALFDNLRERGLLDDLLVLVTADHGLPLGEHGVVGLCRPWLHDELIHLPLLVRLPGGAEAGRRVGALTQPVDLLPTLLDAFGLPVPVVHGHSLLPLCRGATEPVRAYACAGLRLGGEAEWALRTLDWGFLLPVATTAEAPRPPQLYVKPDDRWEVNNVLQHHLELTEHLEQVLRGFVEATRRPGPLQPPELRDAEADRASTPTPEEGQA
jgi:arylsulfatase A-like enzyme